MTRAWPPVVVLLGGPSAEHDVSVVSGTAIAESLAAAGLDVRQVLIDLDGSWWWLPAGHRREDRAASAYDDPAALEAEGPVTLGAALDRLTEADPAPVVFIALHGPFGEDGTVQALLEAAGLAYTGAGVLASALGMDKVVQKRICAGSACRSSTGRRCGRPRGAPIARACSASSRPSPAPRTRLRRASW